MDIIGCPRIEDDGTKENAGGQHRADFKADRRGHSAKGVQSGTFPRYASLKSASQTHARSIRAPPLCGALLLVERSGANWPSLVGELRLAVPSGFWAAILPRNSLGQAVIPLGSCLIPHGYSRLVSNFIQILPVRELILSSQEVTPHRSGKERCHARFSTLPLQREGVSVGG